MKFSLTAQITEVKRELALRKNVYAQRVAGHKMKQAEADMHRDLMMNVQATLEWLQANEKTIRGYVEAMNAAPELKDKIPLVVFFESDADRDELIAAFKERTGMRTVKF